MDDKLIQSQKKFFCDQLTKHRMKKGVSEYQMSLDLGRSKGYIRGITSEGHFPKMESFFEICEYLSLSPEEFFHAEQKSLLLHQCVIDSFEKLDDKNKEMVLQLIQSLADKKPE